jgi:hypothetical protein
MNVFTKLLLGSVLMTGVSAAGAETISIDDTEYSYTTGFEVEESLTAEAAGREAVGLFSGHHVYKSAAPKYTLRPVLAYLQEGKDISADREGVLLTTTFVLRCVDFNRECVGSDLLALAKMNNVNETYKLRTLEVKNLDDWHGVYDYYLNHKDEFAKFYPVLDKGKALHNKDTGVFGGSEAQKLFVSQK